MLPPSHVPVDPSTEHAARPADEVLERSVSSQVHPLVFLIIAALAALFIISAWGFFATNGGYVGLALGVVSIFVFAALAIPYKLWRIAHKAHASELEPLSRAGLKEWLSADLDIWQVRLKCRDAIVAILLPVAAAAFGMAAFAIIVHLAADQAL